MLHDLMRDVFARLAPAVAPVPVLGGVVERVPIPCVILSLGSATIQEPVVAVVRMTILAGDVRELSSIIDRLTTALRRTDYGGMVRGARNMAVRGVSPLEATAAAAAAEMEVELVLIG